jgi:glycerate 2-kinase
MKPLKELRRDAEEIFRSALSAVDAERLVCNALRRKGSMLTVDTRRYNLDRYDRIFVIGAGKASAAMAKGVESVLGGRIDDGIVIVKYGHTLPLQKIRLIEGGHPVPDAKGIRGGRKIMELLAGTGKKDLVFCLLSGGGSALFDDFPAEITLAEVRKVTSLLLSCGASIAEINAVRKHLSRIKGGRVAVQASPATLVSLILSDVIGDDLNVIASGPTVPDPTTFADALAVLERYNLVRKAPSRVLDYLRAGSEGRVEDTPGTRSSIFRRVENRIVGNNGMAIRAAAARARKLGYRPCILTTRLEGEAREAARFLTSVAKEISNRDRPVKKPACLLAGGETTVAIRGKGNGGRNQEMALAASLELAGCEGIVFLSGGTDGTDGPTDAAGGMVDGKTVARSTRKGWDVRSFLNENDSYRFFQQLDGHIITGPTLTNVMDIVIILVV